MIKSFDFSRSMLLCIEYLTGKINSTLFPIHLLHNVFTLDEDSVGYAIILPF